MEQVPSQTHTNIQMERLWITGERKNDKAWEWSSNIWIGSEHINYYAAENVNISDCVLDLQASGRHNILVSSVRDLTVENSSLLNCSSAGAGIWIEEGNNGLPINDVTIRNNIIEDDNTKLLAQDFAGTNVTSAANSVVTAVDIGTFINTHGGTFAAQFKVVSNGTWINVN